MLHACEPATIKLHDGEPRLGLDLPEPEPLRGARVVGVRLVLVELVIVTEGYVVEAAFEHTRLEVRLSHLVLLRLKSGHHPVRHEYVHVGLTRRGYRAGSEDCPVRNQRHANARIPDVFEMVFDLEAMGGDRVYQVRVLEGRRRGPQPRRLVVASRDQVRDVLPGNAEGLFEETDDHVRRGTHGVEDVAGMNDQVDIPLQDGVHSPPVSLLDIDLALVAARLPMQLRVPRVPQVRIRDVGDPYDLTPLSEPALFRLKS